MPAVGAKAFRKKNFAHLVEAVWGGRRWVVADALGFGSPQLVTRYMTSGKSSKPIGDEVARKIEVAARANGADWVFEGYLDTPHETEPPGARAPARAGSLEERISALPAPLRHYLMMELELCERVQHLAPQEFMRPPTLTNRRAFQDWLAELSGHSGGRRSVA